jgi:inhibitor of nuclear factor kappa-B kinase subunit alpha
LLKKHGIKKRFVYRTVKRLRETGSINDRERCGRPRSARDKAMIKKVMKRFRRKRKQSARKMAPQLHISKSSLQRLIKEDLGVRPYKTRKAHGLTDKQKINRLKRCKALLAGTHVKNLDKIVFSDEKYFRVQETHNSQNVRIYAACIQDIPEEERTVQRFKHESKVMIWCGISKKAKFPMVFIEPGVKVNAKYYKTKILRDVVKVEGERIYKNGDWVFQQDSAPAHKAKKTQQWLARNLPAFIGTQELPPNSPDLNLLGYSIWSILEARVNAKRHFSLESLKNTLLKEWNNLSMNFVRAAIDAWPSRLEAVVKQQGGRFE